MGIDRNKTQAAREAAGLTQQQAGEAMGFKATAAKIRWYQIESNARGTSPTIETIEKMCQVLNVGIDQLLADDSPAMPRRRQKRRTPSGSPGSIA